MKAHVAELKPRTGEDKQLEGGCGHWTESRGSLPSDAGAMPLHAASHIVQKNLQLEA